MGALTVSTQDLKKKVLRHCGEVDDGTSVYDQNGQVLEYLNKAYLAVISGGNEFDFELSKPWSWAVKKDPSVVILQPAYQTGTVSLTQGSKSITFSVAPTASLTGYLLQVSDRPDYMRIAGHAAGSTSATLDANYADATLSGAAFKAIVIDYKLAPTGNGIMRLTQSMTVYRSQDLQGDEEQRIYFMDEQEMAKEWTVRRIMTGPPTFFSIQSKDSAGAYYVRFNKVAAELTRVEYKYIEIPEALVDSTTSIPIIPVEHRDCLALAAAHYLLLDKNDSRSEKFMQLTQQKLKAMQKAEEKQKTQTSKLRGKLMPRLDIWQRSKRYVSQETS